MTAPHPTPAPAPSARRSLWAKLRLASSRGRLAWVMALVFLTLATCWFTMRMTPPWYRPLDPDDANVIQTAGRGQTLVKFELRNAAERVQLGPQRWTITQDEINSFLAVNTAPPFDETGRRGTLDPAQYPLTDPYVVFQSGTVTLCARYTKLPGSDPQGGVASVTFSVGTVAGEDGSVMGLVRLTDVHAGRMSLPKSVVQDRLNANFAGIYEIVRQLAQIDLGTRDMKNADPLLAQMVRAAIDGQPFPMRYRSNGKDLAVQELKVEEGRFTLLLVPAAPATGTRGGGRGLPSATLPR